MRLCTVREWPFGCEACYMLTSISLSFKVHFFVETSPIMLSSYHIEYCIESFSMAGPSYVWMFVNNEIRKKIEGTFKSEELEVFYFAYLQCSVIIS